MIHLITAHKRSLGQSNIFRSVSTGGGAGCVSAPGGCLVWGVPVPGGVSSRGSLVWGASGPRGVSAPGGPGGDPPDGYCCGRYASYLNAFLLWFYSKNRFHLISLKSISERLTSKSIHEFSINRCDYNILLGKRRELCGIVWLGVKGIKL